MEAAQILSPLLLFVGNAICGILTHWLHLRLDARQRHPRYLCCAMLFGGGLLFGASFLELLPEASQAMRGLQAHFPFAEVTLCSGFLLSFLGQELLRAYKLFRNRTILSRSSSEGSPLASISGSHYGSTANGSIPMPEPLPSGLFVAPIVQGSLILVGSVSLPYFLRSNTLGASANFAWTAFLSTALQSYLVAYAVSLVLSVSEGRASFMLWGSLFYACVPPLGCVVGLAARSEMDAIPRGVIDALCGGAVLFVTCFEILQRYGRSVLHPPLQLVPVTAGIGVWALFRYLLPKAR
ncbi:unnamed protein product [Ixodes hexagonus]